MSFTKKQVIEVIQAMPQEEFNSTEEIIEELILLEKIEEGLNDLKEGRTITHDELKKEIRSWFTK